MRRRVTVAFALAALAIAAVAFALLRPSSSAAPRAPAPHAVALVARAPTAKAYSPAESWVSSERTYQLTTKTPRDWLRQRDLLAGRPAEADALAADDEALAEVEGERRGSLRESVAAGRLASDEEGVRASRRRRQSQERSDGRRRGEDGPKRARRRTSYNAIVGAVLEALLVIGVLAAVLACPVMMVLGRRGIGPGCAIKRPCEAEREESLHDLRRRERELAARVAELESDRAPAARS